MRLRLAAAALLVGAGCASWGGSGADALRRADAAYAAGSYAVAAMEYQAHVRARPEDDGSERARARLALIHLVYGVPERDPVRGEAWLRELVRQHPGGEYRDLVQYVLALRDEIQDLRGGMAAGERRLRAGTAEQQARIHQLEARIASLEAQIEALKRIDLEDR